MDKLVNGTQLAEHFKVSRTTIYKWIKKGMPYIELGNGRKGFYIDDVERWYLGEK